MWVSVSFPFENIDLFELKKNINANGTVLSVRIKKGSKKKAVKKKVAKKNAAL